MEKEQLQQKHTKKKRSKTFIHLNWVQNMYVAETIAFFSFKKKDL